MASFGDSIENCFLVNTWGLALREGTRRHRGNNFNYCRWFNRVENISRIRMDAARASGTDLASSLRQNTFLIEKNLFLRSTRSRGGVFVESKTRLGRQNGAFPQGRFFRQKSCLIIKNVENTSPVPIADLINR